MTEMILSLGSPAATFPLLGAVTFTAMSSCGLAAMLPFLSLFSLRSVYITPTLQVYDPRSYIIQNPRVTEGTILALDTQINHILDRMPRCTPDLQRLVVWVPRGYHNDGHRASFDPALADTLPSLKQLRMLSLRGFKDSAYFIMGLIYFLPYLTSLTLDLDDTTNSLPQFGPGDFPALTSLSLYGSTRMCANVVASLRGIPSLGVEELNLRLSDVDNCSMLEMTLSVRSNIFQILRVRIREGGRLDSEILDPLFSCRQLTAISVLIIAKSEEHAFRLTLMGRSAWPHIRKLYLGFDYLDWNWNMST